MTALCLGLFFSLVSWLYPSFVSAQKVERAILAFGSSGGNLTAFWVAREAGLYRKYGLDVDVVFLRGSTTAINALASREAQFAALGASSSMLAKLGGADTVLIATAAPGLSFYLVATKEVPSSAALKGKKIAISRPGTDSDLGARFAVQKLGISERDVSFITVGSDMERLMALRQGVVDATVVTPAAYVAARKIGFHALIDLKDLNIPYEAAGAITTRTLIRERPEVVSRFLQGFVSGIHHAKTHRDFTIQVLKKYMRTEDQDVLNMSYDYYVERVIPKTPYVSEAGLQTVLDHIKKQHPQAATARVQDFMDNRFVKELEEKGFIQSLYGR
ncbi:MAG: ABC transporter substrate-binding protein [Deltaproteobacteria bacterium]|nr:ABC transporter substrate-binding protein [Deltaproteobacteria bacterium]